VISNSSQWNDIAAYISEPVTDSEIWCPSFEEACKLDWKEITHYSKSAYIINEVE
jgi:hypothetical protein